MAQVVGASSCKTGRSWVDPESGHMPRLLVRTLVRVCTGGSRLIFLSRIDVSLSLPLSQKEGGSVKQWENVLSKD